QNLVLPLQYHRMSSEKLTEQRVWEVLELFKIDSVANLRPSEVTGAVRKAMCVARAFVHEPQVILLDDPTTGLRAEVKSVLNSLILEHRAQNPHSLIFIATDDRSFVTEIVDSVITVQRDSLTVEGFKEKIA